MRKYAKVINEETKECSVGLGDNVEIFKAVGMTEQDVEQTSWGAWYIEGYAPAVKPETLEEKLIRLEGEYQMNRWQREGILAPDSEYSDFTKARAQELEDIAEQIRGGN